MIRHMRHGSPPRLMALQSILSPNRRESLPTPSAGVRITEPLAIRCRSSFATPLNLHSDAARALRVLWQVRQSSPGLITEVCPRPIIDAVRVHTPRYVFSLTTAGTLIGLRVLVPDETIIRNTSSNVTLSSL